MAGEGGFEPPHTDPEPAVLPLDDSPMLRVRINYLRPLVKVKTQFQNPRRRSFSKMAAAKAATSEAKPKPNKRQGYADGEEIGRGRI